MYLSRFISILASILVFDTTSGLMISLNNAWADEITGTDGDDTLTGTVNADTISGLAGDDLINSEGGKDQAYGNRGER